MNTFEVGDWFVTNPTTRLKLEWSRNEPRQVTRISSDVFGNARALYYVGDDGDEYLCSEAIAWKVVPA